MKDERLAKRKVLPAKKIKGSLHLSTIRAAVRKIGSGSGNDEAKGL